MVYNLHAMKVNAEKIKETRDVKGDLITNEKKKRSDFDHKSELHRKFKF